MKLTTLLLALAATLSFTSCQTFNGLGEDMQFLGQGLQNTSNGKTWNGHSHYIPRGATTADDSVVPQYTN